MTFDRVNRRTHLYLGIALAPWFLLYAVSSVVLNHGALVKSPRKSGDPEWKKQFERAYRLPPITEDSDPWALGETILKEHGIEGRYPARFDDD